nr:hypothetical protein [Methanobrevibacter smithii]
MEKKVLLEKQNKTKNQVNDIIKKHEKDKKIDILDFYPDYHLEEPYSCFDPHSDKNLKPFQLLPFFKNIIIDIKPFKKEKDFINYYGMDVNQLLEQWGKGIFKFRLSHDYICYTNLENDYLDEILDKNPPVAPLINNAHSILVNGSVFGFEKFNSYICGKKLDFGNDLLLDLGGTDPLTIIAMDMMSEHGNSMVSFNENNYKYIVAENLSKLESCGFNEIVDFIKRFLDVGNGRLDWAFVFSNTYANFLSNPILDSLNGTHLVNSQMKQVANDLSIRHFENLFPKLKLPVPNIDVKDSILSGDIAKIMCENINMPTLIEVEDLDNYDNDGPIKALGSLEKAILDKNNNKIVDLSVDLKNELISAADIVKDMQSGKKNILGFLTHFSLGFGVIGEIASNIVDPTMKPLFDALIAIGAAGEFASNSKMLNLILSKVQRLNKSNHVLYLYDTNEYLNFNKSKTIKVSSKKYLPFNDDFTKKYEYFEYLHENIPLLSALMNIENRHIFGGGMQINSDNPKARQHIIDFMETNNIEYKSKMASYDLNLYGVAYIKRSNTYSRGIPEITIDVINPKFIRPKYKNEKIVSYQMINSKNKLEQIPVKYIERFEFPSIIESNIFFLDWVYPQITNKNDRPILIHDIFEKNQIEVENNMHNNEKLKSIFNSSLDACNELSNDKYHKAHILSALGGVYARNFEYDEAIKYFEDAQKVCDECCSRDMEDYSLEISKLIVDSCSLIK